jgi:hypothetical protein
LDRIEVDQVPRIGVVDVDGTSTAIDFANFSKEDQDWIKERK